MNLTGLLIPTSLDEKQALRLRRFGLAALTYALSVALLTVVWAFAVLTTSAMLEITAAALALNIGLYLAIRSGFNLRFKDPSLTRFQILAAITFLMFIVYNMDHGRDIALFGGFVIFLFSVFRFNKREFVFMTLYTLAAYALVINLLMHLRPQAIESVYVEWMSWLALAGLLPGFGIIGAQINALRRRLRESEMRFRSLTEMSSDFYWESDAEHRLTQRATSRNHAAGSVFGVASPIGRRRWDIPYLSPNESAWQKHCATLDAHLPFRDFEFSRLDANDSERYISISGDPVFDRSGAFKGYRGVGTDITARKCAEQTIRESAESLRLFTDNVPVMTTAWDENLCCIFANKRYADLVGLTVEGMRGKHLREVVGEVVYREIEGHFAAALQGHPVTYQRTGELANGESRCFEIRVLPHTGNQGSVLGCFVVTTDITEHKQNEERIQSVAHHDSLTGLPNRLLFNDRLSQAISLAKRDSRQFALLFLDLDKFKPVNDALGHAVGDELLKNVAARIRKQVRESDTVARIGGDEFTVILPEISRSDEAEIVAMKIIAALGTTFQRSGQEQGIDIGTSIGIALYPADGLDVDTLVKAADAAMYSAKQTRNTFRFFDAQ